MAKLSKDDKILIISAVVGLINILVLLALCVMAGWLFIDDQVDKGLLVLIVAMLWNLLIRPSNKCGE